tara:strand:+ start:2944 stop:3276 length:333 start_codon:yes stop_codon:yes gene_type:complete
MTTLPRDNDNNPIQALRLHPDGAHALTATATMSRNATTFHDETKIVSVYSTGPIYLAFGGNDITANTDGHYYPAGLYYDFAIGGGKSLHYTHIAVIAADADCMVYLSEKH